MTIFYSDLAALAAEIEPVTPHTQHIDVRDLAKSYGSISVQMREALIESLTEWQIEN